MYKSSEFVKPVYRTGEIMKILNISYSTVNLYDKNGKIPIHRLESGHRIIFREDLLAYLDRQGMLYRDDGDDRKHDVIYTRVSSREQAQKGDLDRQALFLMEHIPDLKNPVVFKEVGSGLNDKRKKLQELIDMVLEGKVSRVYVTYRDRLTRFGFYYLEKVFSHNGVPVITVKDDAEAKSVNEELVEDMMSLIASFSGKLYGLRSGRNKKKGDKAISAR